MQSGDSGSTQGGQQNGGGGGSSGNGGQTGGGSAGQTGEGGTGNGSGGSSGGGGQTGGGSAGQTGGVVTYSLKGTEWNGKGSGIEAILQFEKNENKVRMEMGKAETGSSNVAFHYAGEAVYTVSGTAVLFDMTAYITGLKNTTTAQYQQSEINWLKGLIAKIKEDIHKTTNPDEKKRLEQNLQMYKQWLQDAENPTSEKLQDWQKDVEKAKKRAAALETHAKFNGTLSSDGKSMTVTNLPYFDTSTGTVTLVSITVTKR